MHLTILPDSDPFLKYVQTEQVTNYAEHKETVKAMFDALERTTGIGLAANQVGLKLNLFIMLINKKKWVVFNPKIVKYHEEKSLYTEGCLSFPGKWITISRPTTISVEYNDASGKLIKTQLNGTHARCFQHEADHLKGVTFDTLGTT